MHTASSLVDSPCFPIRCTVSIPHEAALQPGMIWALSPQHCHVESSLEVCPGMLVSLFLILPDTNQAVVFKERLVTWARSGEFALDLQCRRSTPEQ